MIRWSSSSLIIDAMSMTGCVEMKFAPLLKDSYLPSCVKLSKDNSSSSKLMCKLDNSLAVKPALSIHWSFLSAYMLFLLNQALDLICSKLYLFSMSVFRMFLSKDKGRMEILFQEEETTLPPFLMKFSKYGSFSVGSSHGVSPVNSTNSTTPADQISAGPGL
ncbi:hypothetical protein WICPIJ_006966 [Wickerhamomyces pijperi]|uniref:Uncharacterized protein n=1 Tax=Wickerhamomyces pijperi TaxID=599730 RepID=A0A9P8Q2R0_WICPI|nr:hypothetical protein WICPIJ_006966 [Wickerhamomyces pijperi]